MPRIGVVGTLVWDTIHPPPGAEETVVQDWGGIAYSLAALDAVLPSTWRTLPIIKIGADLKGRAAEFLGSLRSVDSLRGVRVVEEPNNRVELFYDDTADRCEKLTGGVPGWEWEELAPLALSCDALYVNFIAGWELDIETARRMREEFRGLTYCDVHSLLLGVAADGVRFRRPLPNRSEWLASFAVVQVNRQELETLVPGDGEPVSKARQLIEGGAEVVFVTLGPEGAAWAARPDTAVLGGAPPVGASACEEGDPRVDPTGCGDVWGAACFAALMGGAAVDEAARLGNRLATANAAFRGTRDLIHRLRAGAGSGA